MSLSTSTKVLRPMPATYEITKLIKKSPRRNAIFDRLREEMVSDTPGIRVLYVQLAGLLEQKHYRVSLKTMKF